MFKKKMFLWFYLPVILGLFMFSGCGVTTPVTVTGVTLGSATMTLTAGGATGTLVATVAPANATNKSVTWSSSAPAVATVANGVVTPLTAGTTTIIVATVDGGLTATCAVTVNPAAVGDSYGGGIVAYILQDGDPGYDSSVQHGLIAATADQSAGIIWALPAYQFTSVPGTLLTIGSGSANTDKIITQNGTGSTYAAGLARAYSGGGYIDWYLPSKDELNKLYLNRVAVSGFADGSYWSSSEPNAFFAWFQYFYSGSQNGDYKFSPFRVRAVRAF